MRYKTCLVLVSLLLLSACQNNQAASFAQKDIQSLNKQLEAQRVELKTINEKTAELTSVNQQLAKDNQLYSDSLKREYEDMFFLVCSEANSHCPGELKYFDPRKIKQGDVIMGMKVSEIEVGTGDPGAYSISFAETADVSGKYIVIEDDPMGPYLWLDTSTINGQEFSIHLGVGGNQADLEKALKGKKKGEIQLKLNHIILQNLPHKPAFNAASFVSLS